LTADGSVTLITPEEAGQCGQGTTAGASLPLSACNFLWIRELRIGAATMQSVLGVFLNTGSNP
jgi:hypothetical protein